MATTNIAKISGVLSVTVGDGQPKYYFNATGKYFFSTSGSSLKVQIFYSPGVDEYNVEFADLQVNGQTPTSIENAGVLLNAVFLSTNSGSGGSGGGVESVEAAANQTATVDNTDPANPIISSGIRVATVTLTDEQIKALPTTGVEVVPAPGAGKAILCIAGIGILNTTAGAYADDTGATLVISTPSNSYVSSFTNTEGYLSSTNPSFLQLLFPNSGLGGGALSSAVVVYPYNLSEIENEGLLIKDDTAASDYTGGNAANTMKVTVYYVVVDL